MVSGGRSLCAADENSGREGLQGGHWLEGLCCEGLVGGTIDGWERPGREEHSLDLRERNRRGVNY